MVGCKVEFTSFEKDLDSQNIWMGVFLCDSVSQLLCILCMMHQTLVLRKTSLEHRLKEKCETIDHVLYIDGLKLYGKDVTYVISLVNEIWAPKIYRAIYPRFSL